MTFLPEMPSAWGTVTCTLTKARVIWTPKYQVLVPTAWAGGEEADQMALPFGPDREHFRVKSTLGLKQPQCGLGTITPPPRVSSAVVSRVGAVGTEGDEGRRRLLGPLAGHDPDVTSLLFSGVLGLTGPRRYRAAWKGRGRETRALRRSP